MRVTNREIWVDGKKWEWNEGREKWGEGKVNKCIVGRGGEKEGGEGKLGG